MEKAARQFDPVGHTMAMMGLIAGAIEGAVIGALCVATGGAALVVVAAVAAGACAGAGIGEVLGSLSVIPPIQTGMIMIGSPNVFTNSIPAACAHVDTDLCAGMPPLYLPPHATNPIAQGSSNVFINRMPAARRGDKTSCGAQIADGSSNVWIGGGTVTTDSIAAEVPGWLSDAILVVGFAAAVVLAGPAVAVLGLVGGILGGEGGAWLGGKLFGEGSDGQKLMALGGAILGGVVAGGIGESFEGELDAVPDRTCEGDPVDVVTGEVLLWKTDFLLPGALPIELKRNYASALPHSSCFGPHWASTWGQYVEGDDEQATYYTDDGRRITFEVSADKPGEWAANPRVNKIRLRRAVDGFEVCDAQRRMLRFASPFGGRWLLSAIEDANGNAILFTHDGAGALRSVEHSGGYCLQVEGAPTQIQRVMLDGIEVVRYEYDAAGMLVAVIDGSGLSFRYSYDEHGRATRWEDRNGNWYKYRLDDRGRCVEAQGPDGVYHYRILYDDSTRTSMAINSLNSLRAYVHDQRGRVVEQHDARGGLTRTEWDDRGNRVKVTDPKGRISVREYDAEGNLIAVTDGLGRKTMFEYSAAGLPVRLVDANGGEWIRSYDERGNLVEAKGPDGKAWRYERDGLGNLVGVVDPEGRTRRFGCDRRGLMTWSTDWKQARTEYKRDAQGRVTERLDPLQRRTRFAYNRQGKLSEAELPDGARLRWAFDAEGNLTRRTGPHGRASHYHYGAFDVLTEITKPAGGKLQLRYDTELRLRCVENELGQTWSYTHNEVGQVVREVDFHGREQRYEYDGSGLCIKRVNGAGEETSLERDAAGQLVRKLSSDGGQAEYAYDGLGRVTRAVADGVDVEFDRDAWGRVVRESRGGHVVESQYDSRGRRLRRRTAGGTECEWTWDENGQAERLVVEGDELLEFARDAMGREVGRQMRGGLVVRQEYDALDRLKAQWAGDIQREYRYDANGDPIEILDAQWGTSRFSYDDDGRILSADWERGASERFDYDVSGNIRQRVRHYSDGGLGRKTRDYGRDGRLARMGETEYTWDADGRLAEKREGECRWRYGWSAEGRLRSVETPEGERWQYEYDAFGRRVRKSGPKGATEYVWDGATVAEEVRGIARAAWIWQPGTFWLLVKREARTSYTCLTDQMGTPRELVAGDGRVAWSGRLTTWGDLEETRAQQTECPLRFQGQWWDEETGLAYNFHRYYDPASGAYISPDPIGLYGGARNYGYVHNPLGWVDPLGLACKTTQDLSAFGKKTGPRDPRIQGYNLKPGQTPDMVPDANGMVGPTEPPTGASTFADPNQAPVGGHYHTIPAGTELPEGLGVNPDGSDVGGSQPPTHNTIYPTQEMTPEEFVDKYQALPWQYGGKK
jgi:RHS repeat-associated protein